MEQENCVFFKGGLILLQIGEGLSRFFEFIIQYMFGVFGLGLVVFFFNLELFGCIVICCVLFVYCFFEVFLVEDRLFRWQVDKMGFFVSSNYLE